MEQNQNSVWKLHGNGNCKWSDQPNPTSNYLIIPSCSWTCWWTFDIPVLFNCPLKQIEIRHITGKTAWMFVFSISYTSFPCETRLHLRTVVAGAGITNFLMFCSNVMDMSCKPNMLDSFWKFAGIVPDMSQNLPGFVIEISKNVPRHFRECPWQFLHASCKIPGHLPECYWTCRMKFPTNDQNIPGHVLERTWNGLPDTYENLRKVEETYGDLSKAQWTFGKPMNKLRNIRVHLFQFLSVSFSVVPHFTLMFKRFLEFSWIFEPWRTAHCMFCPDKVVHCNSNSKARPRSLVEKQNIWPNI